MPTVTSILEEARRNLVASGRMTGDQAMRLHTAMDGAFPEAMVTGHEPLIAAMKNDAKDRHVAAAAVKAGAQVIVTANLKDFQELPEGIEAQSPDDFLCNLLDLDPEGMIEVIRKQAADLTRPLHTVEELLRALEKTVPDFVAGCVNIKLLADTLASFVLHRLYSLCEEVRAMKSERVYTVADYYDGPRSGVADFEGQPHTFESIYDEAAEEWSDIFLLQRIDPATLDLILADWASWLRWRAAHDRGEVGLDTHPVLPAERAEHDIRSAEIRRRLDARTEPTERKRGRFEGSGDSFRVTWLPAP